MLDNLTSNQKAQQTPRRQPSHKHKAHKPARCLPLLNSHPLSRAHHTCSTNIPIRHAEKKLHDNQVKDIAVYPGAAPVYIAKHVEGDKDEAGYGEEEEQDGAVG